MPTHTAITEDYGTQLDRWTTLQLESTVYQLVQKITRAAAFASACTHELEVRRTQNTLLVQQLAELLPGEYTT